MKDNIDYLKSGFEIQQSMVDHFERFPDKSTRPEFIVWGNRKIKTSDCLSVNRNGKVRFEILHSHPAIRQGFDAKVDGWFTLQGGERVPLLRTWKEEELEDTVEYPFFTKSGHMWVWNVYEMHYPSGLKVEERWTGNAGFWIETVSDCERIYHCSPGMAKEPKFDDFVFKLTLLP